MAPGHGSRVGAALLGLCLGLAAVPAAAEDAAVGLATALKQRLDLFALGAHNGASAVEPRLTPTQIGTLTNLGIAYAKDGDAAALFAGWADYVAAYEPATADIDPLINLVLRECYREGSAELLAYANEVRAADTERRHPRASRPAGATGIVFLAPTTILRLPLPADATAGEPLDLENPLGRQQKTIDNSAMVAETMRATARAILGRG